MTVRQAEIPGRRGGSRMSRFVDQVDRRAATIAEVRRAARHAETPPPPQQRRAQKNGNMAEHEGRGIASYLRRLLHRHRVRQIVRGIAGASVVLLRAAGEGGAPSRAYLLGAA